MSKNGLHRLVDFDTKRLREAILLVKLCTSLGLVGAFISIMACILLGLASIPQQFTTQPRNFHELTPKAYFLGFSFILYFLKISNIVDIYFYGFTHLLIEHRVYKALVRSSAILEHKRHHLVTVKTLVSDKRDVLLIRPICGYLILS